MQVSREHAELYRRGNIWSIRDLGSTNGTQVNGKRVRESFLSDGDILTIAETESHVRRLVGDAVPTNGDPTDSISRVAKRPVSLSLRDRHQTGLNEATLWQTIPLQTATIVSLDSGAVEACIAHGAEAASWPIPTRT